MMSRSGIITATLALVSTSVAQDAPPFTFECNGLRSPGWDDCEILLNAIRSVPESNYQTPAADYCLFVNPPSGTDPSSLNCRIAYCSKPQVAEGFPVTYNAIETQYALVENNCRANADSGGRAIAGNPDFDPQYPVYVEVYSNPEFDQQDPPAAQSSISTSNLTHSSLEERDHARQFFKRQQPPDSDTEFQLFGTSNNVPNPDARIFVFGPSPNGAQYMVGSESSTTNTVGSSASLGASFFDIFSASVSVNVEFSETFTETQGFTYVVTCESDQRGVLYWQPLFTKYTGLYQPSGTQVDWYIANEGDQTSYVLECLD